MRLQRLELDYAMYASIYLCLSRYVYISLDEPTEARAGLYSLRGNDEEVDFEMKEMEGEKQAETEPNMSLLDLLR